MVLGAKSGTDSDLGRKVCYIVSVDQVEIKYASVKSAKVEDKCQVYNMKYHYSVNCDFFVINILIRDIIIKNPDLKKIFQKIKMISLIWDENFQRTFQVLGKI